MCAREDLPTRSTVRTEKMQRPAALSAECVERLVTWFTVYAPGAIENKEFLPGVCFIVEEEVRAAIEAERTRWCSRLNFPSDQ
jgi:hypothetical protein